TANPISFPRTQLDAFLLRNEGPATRTITLSSPLPATTTLDLANVAMILETTSEQKPAALAAVQQAIATSQISSYLVEGNSNRKLVITSTDSAITVHPAVIGDLNFDANVSIADFITLAANFGAA